ncbi:MAG: hypothetical protein JXR71_04085 [Bacteroidales bacterium]|nr:hypothetical protein [Bacteroidales bacterium]
MKLRYTRRKLLSSLIMGLLWLAFGLYFLIENNFKGLTSYLFVAVAIFYFGIFLFESTHQYMTLENGILTRNLLIKDSIRLDEIQSISKTGFYYILKTEQRKMNINTRIIEPASLEAFEKELEQLDVPTDPS